MNMDTLIEVLTEIPRQGRDVYLRVYQPNGEYEDFGVEGWSSYRGYYEQMAINPGPANSSSRYRTVADLVEMLRSAEGSTMQGWKGGDYKVEAWKPVWVAEHGDATSLQPAFLQTYMRDGVTDVYIVCTRVESY